MTVEIKFTEIEGQPIKGLKQDDFRINGNIPDEFTNHGDGRYYINYKNFLL